MVLANLCFAVMAALIRGSMEWERSAHPGSPPPGALEATLVRSSLMLCYCLTLLRRRRGLGSALREARPHLLWLFLRGTFGAGAMLCFFYGSLQTSLATASLFSNSSVFFVIVLSMIFLGERASARRFSCAVGGFVGVALVFWAGLSKASQPDGQALPVLVAFASAPLTAIAYFSVRKMKHLRSELIILSLAFCGSLLSIGALLHFGAHFPLTPLGMALLLSSAIPGIAGQFFMTASFRGAQASLVASAQYTGPVFAALLGATFFNQALSWSEVLGIGIVIAFGVLLPVTEARKAKEEGAVPSRAAS